MFLQYAYLINALIGNPDDSETMNMYPRFSVRQYNKLLLKTNQYADFTSGIEFQSSCK